MHKILFTTSNPSRPPCNAPISSYLTRTTKTCETKSIKLLTVLISPTAIMICNGMQLDRKFTRIRIVLKTKIFFPSVFPQTNTRTRSVFESFSPVHTKTLIQWKKDSIFYRAYDTTVFENLRFHPSTGKR